MKRVEKPQPRSAYKEHLDSAKGECIFCAADTLLLKKYPNWTWMYAAFPYRKYHTLLVPKRHVLAFSDLNPSELLEFAEIIGNLETHYRKTGLIDAGSLYGDQLYWSWRSRGAVSEKRSVEHIHLHIYPKFGAEEDNQIDPRAWDIDQGLLGLRS